jgi:AcrR family transcriptional regulator
VIDEGRRERKKRQTRAAIVAAAFTLFAERGFEGVTVSEISEQADVARATLFSHFPTKDSIALSLVDNDDPAAIAAARAPATTPLRALRSHYLQLAATGGVDPAPDLAGGAPDLLTCVRVITASPTLRAGVNRLLDSQQAALAEVLAQASGARPSDIRPHLEAAQICAVITTLKSGFFGRLAAGESFETAAGRLPDEVALAFDLLENGIESPRPSTA